MLSAYYKTFYYQAYVLGLTMNRPGSTHNGVVLFSSRISVVVADLMVVIFTLVRTFSHVREARRLRLKSSVSRCVIKDG